MSGGIHIYGIILAAGKGERLGPLTQDIPKALVYVAGRTLLEWSVKRLYDAGCSNIILATGWKGDMIVRAAKDIEISSTIYVVNVPHYENGPLQTFCYAGGMVHGSLNILFPVDLIISLNDVKSVIKAHPKNDPNAVTLAIDYNAKSGSDVSVGLDGSILAIKEEIRKGSRKAKSAMLLAFSSGFLAYCRRQLKRGETKIFPVLNDMISIFPVLVNNKTPVHSYPVSGEWFDIDTITDILRANRYLLENLTGEDISGIYIPPNDTMEIGDSIALESGISIGSGVQLKGPCLIQNNSIIENNCIIGPHVSLDENTNVGANTTIQDAVVFGSSSLPDNFRLANAVMFQSKVFKEVEK